ncbi:unnamed protein product [Mytilus coruscus]|uniref:Endonuclease/exonuclease/phosphatase domain-containing protein n=1 Tax=Mytilus coruscus TaxID=42192 RepID=A0A6J8CQM5_MYTCO|nr:unnamed protein product [Mytilus coruscus]
MGVSIEQYRMRIGNLNICKGLKGKLSLLYIFCIMLIVTSKNKPQALALVLLIHLVFEVPQGKQPKSNNTKFIVETCQQSAQILGISFILLVGQILLILGGIETNPGPSDYEPSPDSSINSNHLSNFYDLFSKSLSFLHLNIQSLAPKLDLIAAEYEEFDILAFTESWLNSSHTDDSINLLNFHSPFRRDRGPQKPGVGVVVYVKNNLNVRRRPDLEFDELEAICGHETWDKVETSLDMALNDNKDSIIVSGDFNENQLNISNSTIKALLNQFSLTQMIDEPTHLTENSTSLTDLIMTSNVNEISYCCVGPPLTDQIRKSKEDYNNNLIHKIMNGNPSSTSWWKTVKQFSGIKPSDNSIPPIERNGSLIFDDIEKANEFNSYFASQSNLDDVEADNLSNLNDAVNNLNEI